MDHVHVHARGVAGDGELAAMLLQDGHAGTLDRGCCFRHETALPSSSRSMAAIFSTRRSCRPPAKDVASHLSTILKAASSSMTDGSQRRAHWHRCVRATARLQTRCQPWPHGFREPCWRRSTCQFRCCTPGCRDRRHARRPLLPPRARSRDSRTKPVESVPRSSTVTPCAESFCLIFSFSSKPAWSDPSAIFIANIVARRGAIHGDTVTREHEAVKSQTMNHRGTEARTERMETMHHGDRKEPRVRRKTTRELSTRSRSEHCGEKQFPILALSQCLCGPLSDAVLCALCSPVVKKLYAAKAFARKREMCQASMYL